MASSLSVSKRHSCDHGVEGSNPSVDPLDCKVVAFSKHTWHHFPLTLWKLSYNVQWIITCEEHLYLLLSKWEKRKWIITCEEHYLLFSKWENFETIWISFTFFVECICCVLSEVSIHNTFKKCIASIPSLSKLFSNSFLIFQSTSTSWSCIHRSNTLMQSFEAMTLLFQIILRFINKCQDHRSK